MGMTMGPQGCGDHTGTTWRQHGDNVGTTGMWRPHGDNVSENQSFLDEGAIVTPLIGLVLGGEVPRLNHGPICFPIQNT